MQLGGAPPGLSPLVELRLLGPASVRTSPEREAAAVLAQPKRLALLAFLAAATPYGFHRRDTLLALFWPEADHDHARSALRKASHFLRHELGPGVLVSRGDEELGLAEELIWCDVRKFDRALAGDRPAEALALYRGDLLPGLFISDAPDFEHWLEDERASLRGRAAEVAWTLAGRLERDGDVEGAGRWARWAGALAPDDERAVRRLIALLGRSGDRSGAMRAYEEFAARLRREYDVPPSLETRQLVDALRERREAATPVNSAPGVAPAAINSRPYIAVFPFTVHGDGSAAYLHEGLVDLLSTNLDHAGALHSIDPHALLSLVANEDRGARLEPVRAGELAGRFGAEWYILGSVVGVADRLRINAALHRHDPHAASARYVSVAGRTDELFELVDELSVKLLAELHRGPSTRLARLAAAMTTSLPALKAYLAGEKSLRAGRYIHAVEAYRQAIAQDPDFALAWYRLAFFLSWPALPRPAVAPEVAERALRYKERLSERDGLLLEALTASLRGAADEAERLYREILAIHPEDVEAWIGLGQTLMFHNPHRGRLLTECRTAFERVLALDPDNATAILFLCYVAYQEGRFDDGDRLIARSPAESDVLHPRIVQAFSRGDRAGQEQALAFLRTAPDAIVCEAARFISTLTCDFAGARRVIELLADPMRPPELQGYLHVLAAFLDLAAGRWAAARNDLAEARLLQPAAALEYRGLFGTLSFLPVERAELETTRAALWDAAAAAPGPHPCPGFDVHHGCHPVLRLYLLGGLSARLGDDAALAYAGELDTIGADADGEALARDLALSVRAQHAFWQGEPEAALASLERARFAPRQILVVLQSPFYTGTAERWLRAELLLWLGRGEEALRWYRSLAQASLYDLIYLAPSRLRCGVICERLRDREQAGEHYRRVLELWGDCDPELRPMAAEARTGFERLRRGDRTRPRLHAV